MVAVAFKLQYPLGMSLDSKILKELTLRRKDKNVRNK
jgi:hypothetical protein